MVVSQIGRAAGNACPSSAHLRESASIEEDADVVVLCWWAHLDRPDVDPDRYVLAVAKNRQGGRRERRVLDIDPHTQVLRPIPIEEQERFLDLAK
jgi:replicative DNA helicase